MFINFVKIFLISVYFLLFFQELCCSKNLKIYFLDVGEGESILVQTPNSNVYLIDTGNPVTGFSVVSFLQKRNIKKISALIVTHPHLDHFGGIFYFLQMFQIENKFDNGQILSKKGLCGDFYRWYEVFFRDKNYKPLRAGQNLKAGKVLFQILWPLDLTSDFNRNSLVIKIIYGKYSFLLMADANKEVEKKLILLYGKKLKSNVLKIGHHGASDATSEEFLKIVSPDYAIISINKNNLRGYPSQKVLDLLQTYKIKTFITFKHGTILFQTDGEILCVDFL